MSSPETDADVAREREEYRDQLEEAVRSGRLVRAETSSEAVDHVEAARSRLLEYAASLDDIGRPRGDDEREHLEKLTDHLIAETMLAAMRALREGMDEELEPLEREVAKARSELT